MRADRGYEHVELVGAAMVEGCADYFLGRPLSANRHSREDDLAAFASWREGWLEGEWHRENRGDAERQRWLP